MPGFAEVWLLGVVLTGESTFWLCEPTQLRPVPEDWKAVNCRWLYPVEENLSDFADLDGFDSTDAVYEVDWGGTSKVLRPATLAWNVRGKRQKLNGTTYVFVPAEEIKQLDEAFKKFIRLEATTKPTPLLQEHGSGTAAAASPAVPSASGTSATALSNGERHPAAAASAVQPADADAPLIERMRSAGGDAEGLAGASTSAYGEDGEASVVSSSMSRTRAAPARSGHPRGSSSSLIPSHKRQQPHRGVTIYQAPVNDRLMGDHSSAEAFTWEKMYVVHRGSVDYLCASATDNTYGFRLNRIMCDGFPVFLLFRSAQNNSEPIDRSANGVEAHQSAVLEGEAGEGAVRNSVLVLTRLSSKKHSPLYPNAARRRGAAGQRRRRRPPRRRRRDSDDGSDTTEEEEEEFPEDEDDEDDDASDDTYVDEEAEEGQRAARPRSRQDATGASTAPAAKRARADDASSSGTERRKGRKRTNGGSAAAKEPVQAVSVNFWTDPQHPIAATEKLARDFPFRIDGADVPLTVVFSNGACVTYTAATAAKHASAEKKRQATKHGSTAAASEDADLSMLNEHILSAFAQVREEGA